MRKIMMKELLLSAHILSYLFILFGFMFFLPGYPVLCGAFFVTLGIYQSFQTVRENNDILFSALLPFAKRDVVKGKYLFVCLIELCAAAVMLLCVIVRMTLLSENEVYLNNALMNANFFALGMAFFIFGMYNTVFLAGFFKTAYRFGRPFLIYIILTFIVIFIAEALHYVPALKFLNAFGTDSLGLQICLFVAGVLAYAVMTIVSYNISCRRFEKIDL